MHTAVRAELRELGIDALGMDSADDADRPIASGTFPNVVVLEATQGLLDDSRCATIKFCRGTVGIRPNPLLAVWSF
jgi:hypothetical protein